MGSRIFREGLLDGQVIVVTGGGSGLGRATAVELTELGARVVVVGRREDPLEETASLCASGLCDARACDIREDEAVEALVDGVLERHGRIDTLVNNAGGQYMSPAEDITAKGFRTVVSLNLEGAWLMTHSVATKAMIPAGGGKILNVTSVHEAIPSPGSAAYGAAKGGLLTFTRSLALELAPLRINVNAIAPGLIRTPMTAKRTEDPEAMKKELPNIPWNRPGEPWEIARLALYLVSEDADYVTGQSFTIDGGLEMNWGQGA